MIAEVPTAPVAVPTADAPDVLTVTRIPRRPEFGPADAELIGPYGALGWAGEAEPLREACVR